MPDHHRVIEFLRDVRQGGSGALQSVTDEITQMASDYAELCAQANERLRRCSTFLQEGLRSEAIHLAEEPPNLLDLVAQLDLPDPQAWAEFCQNNGLAVPPPLQLERAAQLNDAYAQDQPLEHLLARHRLAALSRAPVRERLDLMRRIAQIDAGTAHWDKDIRVFERARLKELPAEFHGAVKRHDSQTIAALTEEISQQTWLEPVPEDLRAGIQEAGARMRRVAVEEELRTLIEPLREAYAARSLQECQALAQRWKNAMAAAGVTTVASELMDEIKPVVAFVNEQTRREDYVKRFRESCKAFSKLLDVDAPDGQLESGYARLREFKEEIPEELTRRYMAKKAGRRQDVDRRHKTRLVVIASGAAALIIIALVITWLVTGANTARGWANRIQTAVNARTLEGLETAQRYVDELRSSNPGMLREPAVAAAVSQLEVQRRQYEADATSLRTWLTRIESARVSGATTAQRPEASMEEIRAAAAALQTAVQEAGQAATRLEWADGRRELPAALAEARGVLASMRERVLSVARVEITAIQGELSGMPREVSTPEAAMETQNRISALQSRVSALRDLPLLDDAASAQVAALAQAVADWRARAAVAGDIASALHGLRTQITSIADLKAALENFARRFPADARTPDFRAALARLGSAETLAQWQKLAATFDGRIAPGSEQTARTRLGQVETFLASHPDCPLTDELTRYAQYLRLASEALAERGTWQTAFDSLITSPFLAELTYMEVSDGTRYYTLGDVRRIERRINQQITITFQALELKDPSNLTRTYTVSVDSPRTVSETPLPAPHTRVVADIGATLKLIGEDNWDSYGIDLAERLVKDDTIDPVVRCMLLLETLRTQQAVAGWALGSVYERSITELARQAPAELPWYDPTRISESTLRTLRQTVDALPAAATVRAQLAGAKARLFKAIAFDPVGIGVLLKDDSGVWGFHGRGDAAAGTLVWTMVPAGSTPGGGIAGDAAANPPMTLVRIGEHRAGRYVLDEAAMRDVPQGSLAYVTRP